MGLYIQDSGRPSQPTPGLRKALDSNISFAPAYAILVNTPTEDKGKTDVYIDNNIAIGPDLHAVLLSPSFDTFFLALEA